MSGRKRLPGVDQLPRLSRIRTTVLLDVTAHHTLQLIHTRVTAHEV